MSIRRNAKESKDFWSRHLKQIAQSGLSKKAYCEKHQLKESQLYYWQKRLQSTQKKNNAGKGGGSFVQVDLSKSERRGDFTISLPGGVKMNCAELPDCTWLVHLSNQLQKKEQ